MFSRKSLHFRLSTVRFFLIGLSALIGVQPITVAVALTKDQQRQTYRFVEQLLQKSTGDQEKLSLAASALGQLPCMQDKKVIIGSNEWQELQVDSLIKAIDKTETSLGRVVLRQSIQPTMDIKFIEMRRKQVQALLDDPKLFSSVGKELQRVKKAEDAILAYWDDAQLENQGALFYKVHDFYKSSLKTVVGERANNSKWSLEAAVAGKMGMDVILLLGYLGLEGFIQEATLWSADRGGERKFDPLDAVINGLKTPLNCVNPFKTRIGEEYDGRRGGWIDALYRGSLGDKQYAIENGVNGSSQVDLRAVGRWAKCITHLIPRLICCRLPEGWCFDIGGRINRFEPCKNFADSFSDTGVVTTVTSANLGPHNMGRVLFSWMMAGGISFMQAKIILHRFNTTWKQINKQIYTMKELHVHTIHMARAMNAMKNLAGMVCDHEVLRTGCAAEHMHEVVGHPSADMQKLFALLKESTFTLESAQSHIYSRGNVLLAHRMFGNVKDELVPLLQAIGEIDAVYSMASTIKERQNSDTPFTFVEFSPDAQATINLEQAWLPMVKQPVANSINFGGGVHPNKIIITGPNGGGKSVFLKTLGCCVLLAQSWGIAPAKWARMSLFDGIRSCIHPQESLEHELSTFMAEKMRVDAIKQYVFQNNNPGFKALLLLDEPFKGTVDAESADRIYAFGKEIAPLNGLIVSIATHVEKPIHLAQDTGVYANYHVCIKELSDGKFEREFTIEPGVLRWWFDDPAKRSRFIDFVTLEKHKESLAAAA